MELESGTTATSETKQSTALQCAVQYGVRFIASTDKHRTDVVGYMIMCVVLLPSIFAGMMTCGKSDIFSVDKATVLCLLMMINAMITTTCCTVSLIVVDTIRYLTQQKQAHDENHQVSDSSLSSSWVVTQQVQPTTFYQLSQHWCTPKRFKVVCVVTMLMLLCIEVESVVAWLNMAVYFNEWYVINYSMVFTVNLLLMYVQGIYLCCVDELTLTTQTRIKQHFTVHL